MKALIYIPNTIDSVDINHKFVSTLGRCLGTMADINVQKRLSSPITDYSVVHIVGAWQFNAAQMLFKAKRNNIPTVVSPLGGLEPWIIKKHNSDKILKTVEYERKMIEEASAIHLCSDLELCAFKKLKWNNRTHIINNSIITNVITDMEMAQKMLCLYQKVIDSNCYSMINEDVKNAIGYILHAGIDPEDVKDLAFKQNAVSSLSKLTLENWRHIFIYANNEGIIDILNKGINTIQFNAPKIDVDSIDIFPKEYPVSNISIKKDEIMSKNILQKSKMEDIARDNEQIEKSLCILFFNIKYEIYHHNLSMFHLIELYENIKFNNYDENRLAEMLKQIGIFKFASRLVFILNDVLGLSEGFMPIYGIDDKITDKIRMRITKLQ